MSFPLDVSSDKKTEPLDHPSQIFYAAPLYACGSNSLQHMSVHVYMIIKCVLKVTQSLFSSKTIYCGGQFVWLKSIV